MSAISIELQEQFGALQKGFRWNNIPNFAIITGVNGVGKTHLIKMLCHQEISNKKTIANSSNYLIVDSITHDPVRLILPQNQSNLTVSGLCEYYERTLDRQAQISQHQENIKSYQEAIKSCRERQIRAENEIERMKLVQQEAVYDGYIINESKLLDGLIIYPYEQEIVRVSRALGKDPKKLTREEIYVNANSYFNHLTEIADFNRFIQQDESDLNSKLAELAKEKKHEESDQLVDMPRVYRRINDLFIRFGFNYFEMQDPFPKDGSRKGEIVFLGKRGELVRYDALSDGEKMIVKFIIWAMGKDIRGDQINTMVLDEPDAHLHPKMCQMMVAILSEISRPKEVGGSGIRIILTTHSPSTVAFAPEESLFVMEKDEDNNRAIRRTTTSEAMNILSEGIFTYDKAIGHFSIISNTVHHNIVCVEGKTDILHITTAMRKLHRDLDIELIDLHDAGNLALFIKSTPAYLLNGKRLIGLFDCDDEGRRGYANIGGNLIDGYKKLTGEHCCNNTFALILPLANPELEKYSPIEFLYPLEVLKTNNVLVKRDYQDFRATFKGQTPDEDNVLQTEYKDETTLRPFKANDSVKNSFAEIVQTFDKSVFIGFNDLFDTLEKIIKNV